jgi:hypothetical protein
VTATVTATGTATAATSSGAGSPDAAASGVGGDAPRLAARRAQPGVRTWAMRRPSTS